FRNAVRQLLPGCAAIGGLVQRRLAAAALEVPGPPAVGPHAGVNDVRVGGIDVDVGAPGLVVHEQHFLPALAAIARLEHAALVVRAPLVPHAARVGYVRIARVDADARDAIGIVEPEVRPRLAAIVAAVHAVAERRGVARILFGGSDMDDVGSVGLVLER